MYDSRVQLHACFDRNMVHELVDLCPCFQARSLIVRQDVHGALHVLHA